jgi:archaellum component FlaF (FlaF/FlaG flagellin family)
MGLSHVIPAGVVFIPLMIIVMTIPGISNTILQINQAAVDVSDLENSILNTHFQLSNLNATGDSNLIYFNVTNTGNTKLWDYDNFDLIVTYEGVVGSSATNVTEKLSYVDTTPTGDPIEFDAATGASLGCLIILNPCEFDHTVTTSGSDRILIVGLNTAGIGAINQVNYDGVPMTQIGSTVNNGGSASVSLWYLVNPSTGTNTVSITLAAVTNVAAGAVSFTGVNQTDPIDVSNSATGTSLTPSVSLTTTTDEAWIIDVVGTNGGTITTGTGQVERWNVIQGAARGAGSTEFTSSSGTFTMSWEKSTSSNWAIIAAALRPAGIPCCVSIGDWTIDDISNDSIDPGLINNNETASIIGKTSYQIIDNGKMTATFSTDNGAKVSSFVTPS